MIQIPDLPTQISQARSSGATLLSLSLASQHYLFRTFAGPPEATTVAKCSQGSPRSFCNLCSRCSERLRDRARERRTATRTSVLVARWCCAWDPAGATLTIASPSEISRHCKRWKMRGKGNKLTRAVPRNVVILKLIVTFETISLTTFMWCGWMRSSYIYDWLKSIFNRKPWAHNLISWM